MRWFGGRQPALIGSPAAAAVVIGNMFDPAAILAALDVATPDYLRRIDSGELLYPACTRTLTDKAGDVRTIWNHTRIEAMRYVMMVPRREVELLIDPSRQTGMIEAFLRQRPHEDTVVDFTGVPSDDYAVAIIAGFNWLDHCAALAGVNPDKFWRPLRSFRKLALVAQQWWALDGAISRCHRMLTERQFPPLTVYLVWLEYTRLAKEVASAAIYGSSIDKAENRDREHFTRELAGRPAELANALDALAETMARLRSAHEPDDLLPK